MLLAISMEEEDGCILWILFPGRICPIGKGSDPRAIRTLDKLSSERCHMGALIGRGKMELWRDRHMHEERSFPKESARPKADA